MRLLRFVGLLTTIAAVYFAQLIFEQQSLSHLLPTWLLNAYPPLYRFTRWLPADLFEFALWILALAALGFGLLTPPWRTPAIEALRAQVFRQIRPNTHRLVWWVGRVCVFLAVLSAGVALFYMWRTGNDSRQVQVAWVGALLIYLLGNLPTHRATARQAPWLAQTKRPSGEVYPRYHWMILALLLVITGLLLGWPLQRRIPLPLHELDAQIGLRALAIANGTDPRLFAATSDPIPQLAVAPAALAMRLTGNPLLGARLTGLFVSLLTIVATWLLGNEIFRRPLLLGYFGETLEDEGQWVALLAAALVAINAAIIYIGRLPVYLEPVGWGCLSGWALLRGLRTGDRLAYALGGVLAGFVMLLHPSGLTFLLLAPLWWVGVWLLRITQTARSHQTNPANATSPAMSWGGFFVWLSGVLITTAPAIGLWLRVPALFWDRFAAPFWQNLWPILSAIIQPNQTNDLLGSPSPLLASALIPLLMLAIGVLLLNLDRLPGLLLFLWLATGLIAGSNLVKAPSIWVNLLPIVPALALSIAFVLDRIRITLLASLGTWLAQATTYLAIGLVAWVGFAAWVDDYQLTRLNGNAASYTGYAVRALAANQTAVLLLGQQADVVNWDVPIVDFLAMKSPAARAHLALAGEQWPPSLPLHSQVIMQPEDQTWVAPVMSRYTGGRLTTQRDLHGNPVLYLYTLP